MSYKFKALETSKFHDRIQPSFSEKKNLLYFLPVIGSEADNKHKLTS